MDHEVLNRLSVMGAKDYNCVDASTREGLLNAIILGVRIDRT